MQPETKRFADKNAVRRYFARSLNSYAAAATVQKKMAARLAGFWSQDRYAVIVELGAGTGFLSDEIVRRLAYDRLVALDLVPEWAVFHAARPRTEFAAADMEEWEFPAPVDLVTGNAVLQWATDPARLFGRIHEALRPGGELVFSTFAPGNLAELAKFRSREMNCPGVEELTGLLRKAGFQILRAESAAERMEFASPLALLRHLHDTGVGAPGASGRVWTRARLAELAESCRNRAGTLELNYQPVYLAARKP